jgi:hypothetical protein
MATVISGEILDDITLNITLNITLKKQASTT